MTVHSRVQVLLLARYSRRGASTRLRCLQFLPRLAQAGFEVRVETLYPAGYLEHFYSTGTKSRWLAARSLWRRILHLRRVRDYDLLWVDDEVLPWVPGFVERRFLRNRPFVVDLDDALFHRYDHHPSATVRRLFGHKIDQLLAGAAAVVAGNHYIGSRARAAGAARVETLPTVVDLDRYQPGPQRSTAGPTIGWIGTPETARYLIPLAGVLESFCRRTGSRFLTIGAGDFRLPGVPTLAEEWSEETEVESLQRCDIGIMPLTDGPWESGKSGYKLIQYLAAARPVIASPIGANQEIVQPGKNGFLATSHSEWTTALEALRDSDRRSSLGRAGRERVREHYSLQSAAPRLVALLREAAEVRS